MHVNTSATYTIHFIRLIQVFEQISKTIAISHSVRFWIRIATGPDVGHRGGAYLKVKILRIRGVSSAIVYRTIIMIRRPKQKSRLSTSRSLSSRYCHNVSCIENDFTHIHFFTAVVILVELLWCSQSEDKDRFRCVMMMKLTIYFPTVRW